VPSVLTARIPGNVIRNATSPLTSMPVITRAQPRALILAAGVGRRLAQSHPPDQHLPKALLRFGGLTLLARHIKILRDAGVPDIALVLGYGEDHVRAELATLDGDPPAVVVNPDYRRGSVVSLHTGRHVLCGGTPVILMDADVLYDARLMARLLESDRVNCLLLDRDIEPGDEPVKLCVTEGRIVDFHKRPRVTHDWHGESVGFFRFSPDAARELARRAEVYVESGLGEMEYEEPIRDMMLASPPDRFGFEDISGLPWTEIDFPEDVETARALLPELVG
jgi:choline kinase